MSEPRLLLFGALLMFTLFGGLWLIERARKDAGVVDVGWSTGLGLLAILYALFTPCWLPRRVLLATLVSVWAFRLAFYLLRDRILGAAHEDGRYQALRQAWGARAGIYFFLFFQAQGVIDVVLSVVFLVILRDTTPAFEAWDALAVTLWLVAVIGESTADRQLARFRANPANRGRTCRDGLWAWSRHPNYFFEWLHWWTYPLLAIGAPWGALALLGPIVMAWFLFKITGIPATEARALVTRGDDYRAYQRTVSAFFPWPPRRDPGAP